MFNPENQENQEIINDGQNKNFFVARALLWTAFPAGIFGIHNFLFGDRRSGYLHVALILIAILLPFIAMMPYVRFDWGVTATALILLNAIWSFIEIYYRYYRRVKNNSNIDTSKSLYVAKRCCSASITIDLVILALWLLSPFLIQGGWILMWLFAYFMPIPIANLIIAAVMTKKLNQLS